MSLWRSEASAPSQRLEKLQRGVALGSASTAATTYSVALPCLGASSASPGRCFLHLGALPAFLGKTPQGWPGWPGCSAAFCLPVWRSLEQYGLSKELLDSGISHLWLAIASSNGAPLKFNDLLVGGWMHAKQNMVLRVHENLNLHNFCSSRLMCRGCTCNSYHGCRAQRSLLVVGNIC